MKHIPIALSLLLLLAGHSYAQNTTARDEADRLSNQFVTNYDSLMNSYVVKKYGAHTERHRTATLTETAFNATPDSVIARRLRSMHTVIPMTFNSDVRSHIRLYLSRMSSRLDVMLTLSEYYYPIFEEALARYGVPEELKHLTIVESAMNPNATSRVGAAGLWQFMYTTGKNYGLEVNSVVDERRDAYKASDAAAHYLRDLYDVFNDWTLAIAAYNCGPGNINRAIARSGGKHNFWHIYPYLPRETRGYVPAFIAASYVMTYYPEHGLKPKRLNIPLRTDTIMVERNMLFCFVEKYTSVSVEELRTLNPQYRADLIPGEGNSYPLCLPNNKMNLLIDMADSIFTASEDSLTHAPAAAAVYDHRREATRAASSNSIYHKIRRGETLSSIAKKHGTTVGKIKRLNGLHSDRIREGQRIRVR